MLCTECNGHKSNQWRSGGGRTALNLYLDNLPPLQYLFLDLEIGNRTLNTVFSLRNENGIDIKLFSMLEDHYNNLRLFKRFSEEADGVVSSFKNVIETHREDNTLAKTKEFITKVIEKEQISFGINYWQSILKLWLINNDDFLCEFSDLK
jgi:hypothetical protein